MHDHLQIIPRAITIIALLVLLKFMTASLSTLI